MKRKNLYKICRNDIILAAGLALAAIILFIVFFAFRGQAQADTVVITLNGRLYGTYKLAADISLDIDTGNGNNTVVIQGGKVWMEEADCPDRYCISKGQISRVGETIVCLPHRLVVEIRAGSPGAEDFDVIAE